MGELQAELNRLAGTTGLEAAGAASMWAQGSIGLELVGALNLKAGTTGLELGEVLRRLGVDARDPNGALVGISNVIDLPGTSGNYASTPDSAAVSITGDIDIRVQVALDDWTPSAAQELVTKWGGAQNAFVFRLLTDGSLAFFAAPDLGAGKFSVTPVAFADGAAGWVRVTLDVDNEAVGNDVKFYTSADGVTWAQLGSTQTTALMTSITDTTATVVIGSQSDGVTGMLAGTVYYAEIRNGIGGSVVAKFDATAQTVRGIRTPSSWTATTGEVWTVNGTAWSWATG